MSYDIYLKDPVTREPIVLEEPHLMRGGTYVLDGTNELWLNITYNYGPYYYEATNNDPRFAHEEVSAYYADGTQGPMVTKYGLRGIYGRTGAESIPLLHDMIARIEERYKKDGKWIDTVRDKKRWLDKNGKEIDDVLSAIRKGIPITEESYQIVVNEGPASDYWEPTAGNSIRPLYQLIAMAQMRPDGVWDGD